MLKIIRNTGGNSRPNDNFKKAGNTGNKCR